MIVGASRMSFDPSARFLSFVGGVSASASRIAYFMSIKALTKAAAALEIELCKLYINLYTIFRSEAYFNELNIYRSFNEYITIACWLISII